ncbi:hypothetical protein LCGC14_1191110 [marine sediment metagenome]|uniref:Uncharacterized protein n=1 Tax=marine sediment metagenome TaxID=412755 RepID=A0A0F9PPN2_9ZZZZ
MAMGVLKFKMNPKICSQCGRVMERGDESDIFECVCGNEEQIYYGREED